MNSGEYRAQQLSPAQVVDLLGMALGRKHGSTCALAEYQRLAGLPVNGLTDTAFRLLARHGVGHMGAAQLLGVTEISVRRWSEGGGGFTDAAKLKLAGMCTLLELSEDCEARRLVDKAISLLGAGENSGRAGNDREEMLVAAFGIAGLMAAALYLALGVGTADSPPETCS